MVSFFIILQLLFYITIFLKPYCTEDLRADAKKGVFHFPRNKRPRTPFGGISDILAYSPSGSDEKGKRSCSHNVTIDGFNLAYNVTLRKGVFNIDEDDRVLHINCDYDTKLVQVELISTDPQSLFEELSISSYIIGDHSWGCLSGIYDEDRAEPTYRKIVNVTHVVSENSSVILTTALANFVELFERTNIQLDIAPNFVSPFNLNNGEDGVVQNNQANQTHLNTLSFRKDLQTNYFSQNTFQFSYNYDLDREVAQTSRVPLNSLVTCEECFYNFNPGFTFNLDIELSQYYIPYAQNLEMSFYGSGVVSAYMRMKTPETGASPEYALTAKESLPTITLYIFFVPFIIYPSFQMFAQYNITDASLPITIFGGFTATATNVKYGYKTVAGGTSNTVISGANFSFKGTPLSSAYDKSKALSGSFQPRLYLIPRVYLSPYGLVNFAIDVKPYLGVALWTTGLGLPSNPYRPLLTVDQFNKLSVPSQPPALSITTVTQNSAYINIPLPNAGDPSVYYYQVRMKSTSIFSFFSDYVTLSELGYFQTAYLPNCFSATYYSFKTLASPYNTPIQCSQLCYGDGDCNSYTFSSSTNNCYMFNISSHLLTSSGCAYNYLDRNQYQIRESDPFGYTVDNNIATAQSISFQLASNSFYVSYRALNLKGYSSWSIDTIAAFSVTAQLDYSGGGNIYLKVSLVSNLHVGEVVTVNIYNYGTFSSTLLTSQYLTISSTTNSLTILIGNFVTSPYKLFGSNYLKLYCTVNYPSSHEVYSGYYNTIAYYPVVIIYYSYQPTYVYYEFYANPNQVSKVRLHLSYCASYFFGLCSETRSAEGSQVTSTICSNNFCKWSIGYSFASGTTYTLAFYATDTSGSEVQILSNSYTPSRRMTEELVDGSVFNVLSDMSNFAEEAVDGQESPDITGEQIQQSHLEIPNQIIADYHLRNEEQEDQVHLADISWLQGYTYCAPQTVNGLNYAFYYGVDIAISMQAISIFGFVLFPAWKTRNFALISPKVFSDFTYATGCFILPPIPPSIVIKSPISSDEWGLTTTIHHIVWDFYSIATNASVSICIFDSSLTEVDCTDDQPIDAPYELFLDPSLFEVDERYYARVAYSSSVFSESDFFTVVSASSDLSVRKVISISDQPYDDSFTSIGTIFSLGTISIHTLPGTRCQAQYKKYPLNVYCAVTLGINVSSLNIYQFTFSIGLSVEDATKLRSNEFGLLYGINFPEFVFPTSLKSDSSIVSYFLKKLAGEKLTNGGSFPNSDGESLAEVTVSPGGEVCLSSLIAYLSDDSSDYDSCSDIKLAAQKVSKIIDLLGMDACLQINIASVDVAKGGLIFQAILNATAFDASKVDWSEYLGQETSNPYMEAFVTLSGTSTADAVSSIFQKMLKILHIPSTIEMSKNFGRFASTLLYPKQTKSSRRLASPSFIDSNGNFLLGSSATGQSLDVAPTTVPTVSPSEAPLISTITPTLVPSNVPTFTPSLMPSTNPSKNPTFSPTGQPSLKPSSNPSPSPSVDPSTTPTVIPSVTPSCAPTSIVPSMRPSGPSIRPTFFDTTPSCLPSLAPSSIPSLISPTVVPSGEPSSVWSVTPSVSQSLAPIGGKAPTACPSIEPSSSPTAQTIAGPTRSPTTRHPTVNPSPLATLFPTTQELQSVSIQATQFISGISVLQYYSNKNYSLTLRSAIASCLSDVKPSNIIVLNVSALQPSRRRLEVSSTALKTVGISVAYLLAVESKFPQSSYQQQLTTASTTGAFNTQLHKFSSYYATPGFKNATSLGVVVHTSPPSAKPSTSSVQSLTPTSSGSSNIGVFIGIGVGAIFIVLIIIVGLYYLIQKRRSAAVMAIENTLPTGAADTSDVIIGYNPSRRQEILV